MGYEGNFNKAAYEEGLLNTRNEGVGFAYWVVGVDLRISMQEYRYSSKHGWLRTIETLWKVSEEKHSEVSEKVYSSENGDSIYLKIVTDKEPEVLKK